MKKLAALVLSFGMLFSMAACSGSKVSDDALDKLESSVKKFSEVKNANYSADMDVVLHANRKNVANKLRKIDFQKKTFQMVFKSQIKRLFSFIFFSNLQQFFNATIQLLTYRFDMIQVDSFNQFPIHFVDRIRTNPSLSC